MYLHKHGQITYYHHPISVFCIKKNQQIVAGCSHSSLNDNMELYHASFKHLLVLDSWSDSITLI